MGVDLDGCNVFFVVHDRRALFQFGMYIDAFTVAIDAEIFLFQLATLTSPCLLLKTWCGCLPEFGKLSIHSPSLSMFDYPFRSPKV